MPLWLVAALLVLSAESTLSGQLWTASQLGAVVSTASLCLTLDRRGPWRSTGDGDVGLVRARQMPWISTRNGAVDRIIEQFVWLTFPSICPDHTPLGIHLVDTGLTVWVVETLSNHHIFLSAQNAIAKARTPKSTGGL
ncbi:hypothetical protein G7054_g2409 [Neopestalotiopsis clavispora]|jgi:hypothetical protein|nr:hypothetical protein G7054_g2409 [Neopestalotiopsis clavispora]